MNFLAHAVLSFNHPELLVGNMISDFVKGKNKFNYSGGILAGINLHRKIDAFTDDHPVTGQAKEYFRSAYRLYSGPITDVIYDHFLATDPNMFPGSQLEAFTHHIYQQLEHHAADFPPHFTQVFYYMRTQNWLYGYRQAEGIRRSLQGLARRSTYMAEADTAYALFLQHYDELRQCYRNFFPEVQAYAKQNAAPFV